MPRVIPAFHVRLFSVHHVVFVYYHPFCWYVINLLTLSSLGEECCKRCCYSTPYGTLFAVSVAIVGLVGFVAAAIYGVVMMSANQDLNRQ